MRVSVAGLCGCKHACNAGVIDEIVADLSGRRGIAASDTRRAHDPNAWAGAILDFLQ